MYHIFCHYFRENWKEAVQPLVLVSHGPVHSVGWSAQYARLSRLCRHQRLRGNEFWRALHGFRCWVGPNWSLCRHWGLVLEAKGTFTLPLMKFTLQRKLLLRWTMASGCGHSRARGWRSTISMAFVSWCGVLVLRLWWASSSRKKSRKTSRSTHLNLRARIVCGPPELQRFVFLLRSVDLETNSFDLGACWEALPADEVVQWISSKEHWTLERTKVASTWTSQQ